MLQFPSIDPVAFRIGFVAIHWYGLMYLVGFFSAWVLLSWRLQTVARDFTREQLSDILFYGALGIIIGGRVGYMMFYDLSGWLHEPLRVFKIWQGGMSFHGGLIGVILALAIYARHIGKSLIAITDFIAPVVPIGLGAGRIGNFINGELWGRVTDVSWGIVFPYAGDLPRHPSQLYELCLEGVALFVILWAYSSRQRPKWAVSGLFLLCYGVFRFSVEFFREPDAQIGYVAFGWVTKGQVLSLPMALVGLSMFVWAYHRK